MKDKPSKATANIATAASASTATNPLPLPTPLQPPSTTTKANSKATGKANKREQSSSSSASSFAAVSLSSAEQPKIGSKSKPLKSVKEESPKEEESGKIFFKQVEEEENDENEDADHKKASLLCSNTAIPTIPILLGSHSCGSGSNSCSSSGTEQSLKDLGGCANLKAAGKKKASTKKNTSSKSKRNSNKKRNKKRGGLKSLPMKVLTHPLDRSIGFVFVVTLFFTLLAIASGLPTVAVVSLLLPLGWFLKKLLSCQWRTGSVAENSSTLLEPLSPVENFCLYGRLKNNNKQGVATCLLYVDRDFTVEQLRDVLTARVLQKPEYARFRSQLVFKGKLLS